ncbi:GIY-YIG nuclease family protein [Zhongshania aliphaticivorans]|nr:GIY-YIG nuclease family protein [Zhongshania aliphaticivorans]
MVRSRSGKLYTGISTDPERRFREHGGEGGRGARFFRGDPPQAIVYREPVANRSIASQREAAIKKMRRPEKESLIE